MVDKLESVAWILEEKRPQTSQRKQIGKGEGSEIDFREGEKSRQTSFGNIGIGRERERESQKGREANEQWSNLP